MLPLIPHLDVRGANAKIKSKFFKELHTVYDQAAFSGGANVERFETEFGHYLSSPFCVGVNSGTSAIHLALLALGIGPGDEVVVPAYTFVGSLWGVIYCGAKPVFADVDVATGNLVPEAVEKVLTPRTRAIIVVHLFGQCAAMPPLQEIARRRKLFIVEDAAQAHGQIQGGQQAGTMGDFGCFSFYPTKNLGGIGEAGAVVTKNRKWAKRIQLLRNHNSPKRFTHIGLGFNYRMDGIQAQFLRIKLKELDKLNAERRRIASVYLLAVAGSPLVPLCPRPDDSVWHAFVCKTPHRKALLNQLDAAGIGHAIYYPKILPEQTAFRGLVSKRQFFPGAKALSRSAISLPLYPGLTQKEIKRVVAMLQSL